jgi:HD-like signal output (HDOD) protein
MDSDARIDKHGKELSEQRFQLLKDIAKDLSEETSFPTSFDLLVRLRKALQDSNQTIDQIASLISLEPLIPLRLIHLANSVAYNRGTEVKDTKTAVQRLGLNNVRITAMAIAMNQLLHSKSMVLFGDIPQKLWDHSLRAGCAARVIAKQVSNFNPDEAMLAGVVHDLGAFYLLYRFSQYEELRIRPESAKYLVAKWHESIGLTLLQTLGIPEEIALASADHDTLRPVFASPSNLADIVYVSNALAGGMTDWLGVDEESDDKKNQDIQIQAEFDGLQQEIEAYTKEMRSLLT